MQTFSSTNSNHSTDEMSVELTELLPKNDAEKRSPNILRDHMYAKSPESESETFDISSPKSVDSGISGSYDEVGDIADFFISEKWKVYISHDGISLLESKSTDIDFFLDKQSTTTNELLSEIPRDTSKAIQTNRYSPYKDKQQKTVAQKLRKKEHNRKSASKYRSKKKEEFGTVFNEAEKLEEKNKGLKVTVEDLQKEIDYLKSLMLDVISTRLSKRNHVCLKSLIGHVSN